MGKSPEQILVRPQKQNSMMKNVLEKAGCCGHHRWSTCLAWVQSTLPYKWREGERKRREGGEEGGEGRKEEGRGEEGGIKLFNLMRFPRNTVEIRKLTTTHPS